MTPSILEVFILPGWNPNVYPAPSQRDWMDNAPERFVYRCLPLAVANAHGWEILSPCALTAYWTGSMHPDGVVIDVVEKHEHHTGGPVAIFGQAVLTFHIAGIFRTSPGWNLYVTGSPNRPKDAIYPLSAVVETDWSIFTFTMNWQFTRANTVVRFEKHEPICFIYPVLRNGIDEIKPRIRPITDDPYLNQQFSAWQISRDNFHAQVKTTPVTGAAAWQKHYFKGTDMDLTPAVADHKTKLRVQPFSV